MRWSSCSSWLLWLPRSSWSSMSSWSPMSYDDHLVFMVAMDIMLVMVVMVIVITVVMPVMVIRTDRKTRTTRITRTITNQYQHKMTHYHQLPTSIAIYWPSTVLPSNNQYEFIIHHLITHSWANILRLIGWVTHSILCLVTILIVKKNENLTPRRASYASNRDKLGSKSSLYQSTSSLHASEQVRETNIQVFFGRKIPCIKDTPITDQFRKIVWSIKITETLYQSWSLMIYNCAIIWPNQHPHHGSSRLHPLLRPHLQPLKDQDTLPQEVTVYQVEVTIIMMMTCIVTTMMMKMSLVKYNDRSIMMKNVWRSRCRLQW